MDACEVLVVGGGPAGSTCARRLRQAGLDVLLMDSRLFPRDKPCAGWITPAVLETLQIDRDDYRQGRVFQDIRGFRTAVMHGAELVTRYDRSVSYGIRRCEFDHYLLQRSAARQVLGEPVAVLERKNGNWIVNGRITARIVVGAGGHSCPVARLLGAKIGAEQVIVAQSAEFAMAVEREGMASIQCDTPELFFSRDLKGYGWIFRKGAILNVGFGRMDRCDFGRHMTEFRTLLEKRRVLAPGSAVKYQGHAYLAYQRQGGRRVVGDGVLLIGDSAGLAHPYSGEGILPAIESALLAAQTILAAKGDYRSDNLEPYLLRLAGRYGGGGQAIPLPIPSGLIDAVGTRLFSSRLFVRNLVLQRWFLHSKQKTLTWESL